MATSEAYIQYVCDQAAGAGALRYRKMFREYMVYVNEKPLLTTVCDDTVYVKRLPELAEELADAQTGAPYEGAKEHYILDVDDREKLLRVLAILEPLIPVPQPRRRKPPKAR